METQEFFVARFQIWESNGQTQFANTVFTSQEDAEADMKMSDNSIARTQYREFPTEAEAWAWLREMEEEELA